MTRALKSMALASLMALGFAGPVAIAAAAPAAAYDHYYQDNDRHHGRNDDRHDRRDHRRDRHSYREGYYDGRRYDRDDRRHYRDAYAYADRQRYDRYAERHYWRRGEYLPRSYWGDYRVVDYRRYDLAPPPRGYHYRYDDDRSEYLLVGIATGFILGAIAAH